MDKNTTPLPPSQPIPRDASSKPILLQPSEKTIALLKSLARNLRMEPQLPQGLQQLILG